MSDQPQFEKMPKTEPQDWSQQELQQRARRRVAQFNAAVDLLLKEEPFFYYLLSECQISWNNSQKACAAIGMRKGKPVMFLNDLYMEHMDPVSYKCILVHEMMHVALKHLVSSASFYSHKLQNIAQDILINYHIKEFRSKTAPVSKYIWHWDAIQLMGCLKEETLSEMNYEKVGDAIYQMVKDTKMDSELDEHGIDPGESIGCEAEIYKAAQRTVSNRGIDSVPPYLLQYVSCSPSNKIDEVDAALQSFVNVVRAGDRKRTWKKQSRRWGSLAKGLTKAPRPKIAFLVDTSGSMAGAAETMVLVAKAILGSVDEVRLVVGDTAVRSDTQITAQTSAADIAAKLLGGGGTVLQPLFDAVADGGYSGVICLTDGYTDTIESKVPARALIVPGGNDMPGVKSIHLTSKYIPQT